MGNRQNESSRRVRYVTAPGRATDDQRVCPRCGELVSLSSWENQECPDCGADLSEAPTAFDRVHADPRHPLSKENADEQPH